MKNCSKIDGERLNKLIKQKGISKRQLARDLNMGENPNRIKGWIDGKGISSYNLSVLSEYFGVSIDYLCGLSDEPNIQKNNYKKYKTDKEYMSSILEGWKNLAQGKGIDFDFISSLRKHVDFDKYFPLDGYVQPDLMTDSYIKGKFPTTVKLGKNSKLSVLQISKNGETRNMCLPDILFLMDLQEHLFQCAIEYMEQRSIEISQELDMLNQQTKTIDVNGVHVLCDLSAKEINDIVRYPIYKEVD